MTTPQFVKRYARSILGSAPVRIAENLSGLVPRRHAPRLLRLAVENRDVIINHGLARGLRFNAGRYNYSAALGYYELPVQRAISEHLRAGGVCYDVGANVGFFSVLAASLVGAGGKVFAFEPEPENAAMLRHNVDMNGFTQVSIIEKAVSSRAGRGTLLLTPYCGSHALAEVRTPKRHVDQITVEIVQIDQLVERGDLSAPTLVKIDAEGAEFDVIRGMLHTIETYKPKIVYETDAEREDEAKERQRNIEQLLRARDYDIHRLEDSYIGVPHYVAHFLAQPA